MPFFKSFYRRCFFQGQGNIIQTTQQSVLTERINVKAVIGSGRGGNFLLFEVNRQLITGGCFNLAEQQVNSAPRQDNREDAVFEAVVVKDISITGGNDDPKAVVEQGPGGMFTR